MNKELQSKIISFFEGAEKYIGCKMKVIESISTNRRNFNRHFVTNGFYYFILKRPGWRVSGARFMFDGEDMLYEISADRIVDFTKVEENEFEFLEAYSDTIYRKTKLKFHLDKKDS